MPEAVYRLLVSFIDQLLVTPDLKRCVPNVHWGITTTVLTIDGDFIRVVCSNNKGWSSLANCVCT